jgi:leader peptidase (prepilin peptidase)/N-methyltransferase
MQPADIAALLCLAGAIALLVALSVIDLRTRLLPNRLVLPFALLAIAFHLLTGLRFAAPFSILMGGALGFGLLWVIRFVANYIYKQDTLGLGDVKLIGAAGLWLGADFIMLALSAGAFFAALHGCGVALAEAVRTRSRPRFHNLQIPAGPGFAAGIVAVGIYAFRDFRPF